MIPTFLFKDFFLQSMRNSIRPHRLTPSDRQHLKQFTGTLGGGPMQHMLIKLLAHYDQVEQILH
jgi:hypothetical protein